MPDPREKNNLVEMSESMRFQEETADLKKETDDLKVKFNDAVGKLGDRMAQEITNIGIDDAVIELVKPETELTRDQKLKIMGKLFPYPLGTKVKNLLDKEGIVEMIGIDYRGALYLVEYDDLTTRWEAYPQIERIVDPESNGMTENDSKEDSPRIKTDIPDPNIK